MACCSWRSAQALGVEPLALGGGSALAAFAHLRETDRRGQRQGDDREHEQQRDGAHAQSGARRQPGLQLAERQAQRFAVGQDRRLRLARHHQPLHVAEDRAGLGAHALVAPEDRLELVARLGIARAGQALLRVALEQAARDLLEAVQVAAEQRHGRGTHAFDGVEFGRRLADALREHHQLSGRGDLRRAGALLQLERRHHLRELQQFVGLPVDVAQGGAHARQDVLLGQHRLGAAVGALGQGPDLLDLGVVGAAHALQVETAVALRQPLHAAREVVGTLAHLDEGRGVAHQRLRHRLGQPLRLHQ